MEKQLRAILKFVHRNFTYVSDKKQFNEEDHWYIPRITEGVESYGDCEDFALACRYECEKAGIESRLIICKVNYLPDGENGHAVLESHGFILDVNSKQLVPVKEFGKTHKLLYISGKNLVDDWRQILGLSECYEQEIT